LSSLGPMPASRRHSRRPVRSLTLARKRRRMRKRIPPPTPTRRWCRTQHGTLTRPSPWMPRLTCRSSAPVLRCFADRYAWIRRPVRRTAEPAGMSVRQVRRVRAGTVPAPAAILCASEFAWTRRRAIRTAAPAVSRARRASTAQRASACSNALPG